MISEFIKTKKVRVFIAFAIIATIIIAGYKIISTAAHDLENVADFSVKTMDSVKLDKVKIKFKTISANIIIQNDSDLFKSPDNYSLIYDGSQKSKIVGGFGGSGEEDFIITYNDEYYYNFRISKNVFSRVSYEFTIGNVAINDTIISSTDLGPTKAFDTNVVSKLIPDSFWVLIDVIEEPTHNFMGYGGDMHKVSFANKYRDNEEIKN